MRLLLRLCFVAALSSLGSCVWMQAIQTYVAADGSSRAGLGDGCRSPWPASSTTILDQADVQVRFTIEVDGPQMFGYRILWHIVVEPRAGAEAWLADTTVQVTGTNFAGPMAVNVAKTTSTSYEYYIYLDSIPPTLSIAFPKLIVKGRQVVELGNLALRSERSMVAMNLMCADG